MSFYQKVMDLAKAKGLNTVTQICDACDISAANWYRFRSTDKASDALKEKLALGFKVSIGDINECKVEALSDDLKEKDEFRPGEPNKQPKKKSPKKEPATEEAPAEPVEVKAEEPEESSIENMPEAVKVEEAPAIDRDVVLEGVCNEVTKGYLPKPTYWDEIKEQAYNNASEAIKVLVAEQMVGAIIEDMKVCVAEFEKTGEMCFVDQLHDDVIPALKRACMEAKKQ